jgi:hypothetical protein
MSRNGIELDVGVSSADVAEGRVRHFDQLTDADREYVAAAAEPGVTDGGRPPGEVSLSPGDVVVYTDYVRVSDR